MKAVRNSFFILLALVTACTSSREHTPPPPKEKFFTSLRLPPLPATALMPSMKNATEAENFIAPFHEFAQYDWHPSYSVFLPAFDSANRPYFREHNHAQNVPPESGFQTFRDGKLVSRPLPAELSQITQDILWDPKLAVFDKKDRMYTIVRLEKNKLSKYAMLYSFNQGETWQSLPLAGPAELYDLERPYSKEPLPGPPAFLYHVSSGKLPGYETAPSWLGTVGKLYLQPTHLRGQKLEALEPVLISNSAQEIGYRSGGSTKVIRHGSKYYVTWLETTPDYHPEVTTDGKLLPTKAPSATQDPTSEIWVAEYDMETKVLTKRSVLKTFPVNDSHNQPGILRASDGSLHIITGGHGSHFMSSFSTKANSVASWSEPQIMNTKENQYQSYYNLPNLPGGGQTYISAVMDDQDRIHTVYREWIHDESIFKAEYFGALSYQEAQYDKKTQKLTWQDPRVLIYPNAAEYTHWYQLMTMDRKGNLFIEYANSRPYAPYFFTAADGAKVNISPMQNNALIKSEDGGRTWFFPADEDLTTR